MTANWLKQEQEATAASMEKDKGGIHMVTSELRKDKGG